MAETPQKPSTDPIVSNIKERGTQGVPLSSDTAITSLTMPMRFKLLGVVALIGIGTGLATFLMKEGIKGVGWFTYHGMHIDKGNPLFLVMPLLGIMLAMIFQRFLLKEDLSHGTAMIKRDLRNGEYVLAPNLMFTSLVGCSVTIGFGGSAGAEGPSAYTGAAIASRIGSALHLSQNWLRVLVAIGAGAGIAGIFKSPVGGALFTLEVIGLELTTYPVILLMIGCLVSGCTALALGGFNIDINFIPHLPFNPGNILWMILLGLFCGIYSIYYNLTKQGFTRLLTSLANPWARALLAGGMLSMTIYFFPALYGEGYGIVGEVINGHSSALLSYSPFYQPGSHIGLLLMGTLMVMLLKGLMVSATIDGGGVAGDFAPTLFAGCLAGYLFGLGANHWFGASLAPGNFALLGMAAVMAAAIKAPLMAIFITSEMSNSYEFIFGFLIVAAVSYAVMLCYEMILNKKKKQGKGAAPTATASTDK